jgi:hypothetical protein
MELHVFDGLTGSHVCRLSAASCTWSDSINEIGSMTATVIDRDVPDAALRCYGTIWAVLDPDARLVRHAGYLTHWRRSRRSGTVQADVGGGATILGKRLVLNHDLDGSWVDGSVSIDEDNPTARWVLTANGSYSDLIRALIVETEKWGSLPITPATATGGNKTRTWQCWEMATVLDRIQDIGDLEAGPEWRFDPELSSAWALSFSQVTSADGGEVVDHSWTWNALVPGSGVQVGDEDADGTDMCTSAYEIGQKDQGSMLLARRSGNVLSARGWPLMQAADTSHSSVTRTATLASYARAAVGAGDSPQVTVAITVPSALDVRVGDHADVRVGDAEGDVLRLKVTDVKGSMGSGRLTLGTRERQ